MHRTVLVGALLLTVFCTGINSVFLQQPSPRPLFSPVGKLLVLDCAVDEGFFQAWSVALPNISTTVVTTDRRRVALVLNNQGIYIQEDSDMMSQLFFNGTRPIEFTVTCFATSMSGSEESGNEVSITIYDSPPTPTNLEGVNIEPGSINISWAFTFIAEVTVNFTLTAVNLTASTSLMTQEQHYTFRVQDVTSCDVYNFSVTAVADSGSSLPSEVITRSIPSLPDIALVASSVTHFLVKNKSGQFFLNIRIEDISACLYYPVLRYIVTLEDGSGISLEFVANTTNITINNLAEDTHYAYYIRAENQFGSSRDSARFEQLTTDVQNVSISQINDSRHYLIQCNYVEGSDACGCAYTISANGIESVTGTIARSNTEGVIVELTCFNEVLVYDWECDNRMQSVSISISNVLAIEICPESNASTATTKSSDNEPRGNVTVFVVVASVLSAALV